MKFKVLTIYILFMLLNKEEILSMVGSHKDNNTENQNSLYSDSIHTEILNSESVLQESEKSCSDSEYIEIVSSDSDDLLHKKLTNITFNHMLKNKGIENQPINSNNVSSAENEVDQKNSFYSRDLDSAKCSKSNKEIDLNNQQATNKNKSTVYNSNLDTLANLDQSFITDNETNSVKDWSSEIEIIDVKSTVPSTVPSEANYSLSFNLEEELSKQLPPKSISSNNEIVQYKQNETTKDQNTSDHEEEYIRSPTNSFVAQWISALPDANHENFDYQNSEIDSIKQPGSNKRRRLSNQSLISVEPKKSKNSISDVGYDSYNESQTNSLVDQLFIALKQNNIYMIKDLISNKGVDINSYNKDNYSTFYIAMNYSNITVLNYLIEHGVNIFTFCHNGLSAIKLAQLNNREDIRMLLVNQANIRRTYAKIHNLMYNLMIDIMDYQSNLDSLQKWIEQGVDINGLFYGYVPLHIATMYNRIDIVRWLILNEANINVITKHDGYTALCIAAENNFYDIAELLIRSNADINIANTYDLSTPLHYACRNGNTKLIKLILDYNGSIDKVNINKLTPLKIAQLYQNKEVENLLDNYINYGTYNDIKANQIKQLFIGIEENNINQVEKLLSDGVNANSCSHGCSALQKVLKLNFFGIANLLIENGANIQQKRTKDNASLLHIAVEDNNINEVSFLLSKNIKNLDDKTKNGMTALHIAVQNGSFDIVQSLVNAGVAINILNNQKQTPIQIATEKNYLPIVYYLQSCINKINTKNGVSLLLKAINQNKPSIVKQLITQGIDINNTDIEHPLIQALVRKRNEIAMWLINNGANVNVKRKLDNANPLYLAIVKNNISILQSLLDHNADVINSTYNGMTLLQVAAKKGNINIVKRLIQYGANVTDKGLCGFTPLQLASQYGRKSIVHFLKQQETLKTFRYLNKNNVMFQEVFSFSFYDYDKIKNLMGLGANPNTYINGSTPLLMALDKRHIRLANLLIKYGADIHVCRTSDKMSALHLAILAKNFPVIQHLVKNDIDVNAVAKDGTTALHIAAEHGYIDIVKYLINNGAYLDMINDQNKTPLDLSLYNNHIEISKFISNVLTFKRKLSLLTEG